MKWHRLSHYPLETKRKCSVFASFKRHFHSGVSRTPCGAAAARRRTSTCVAAAPINFHRQLAIHYFSVVVIQLQICISFYAEGNGAVNQ
jgi:hypothetical protein